MAADARDPVRGRLSGLWLLHRVMITVAIAFCAVFAAREIVVAARGGGAVSILLSAVSAGGAVALSFYLRWWLREKARPVARS